MLKIEITYVGLMAIGKNRHGGKKHKKTGNKKSSGPRVRPLDHLIPDNDDPTFVYGKVTKSLGNRRFSVSAMPCGSINSNITEDSLIDVNCMLRGSIKSRLSVDQYVLVQLPPDADDKDQYKKKQSGKNPKGYIVIVYNDSELTTLRRAKLWTYPEHAYNSSSIIFANEEDVEYYDDAVPMSDLSANDPEEITQEDDNLLDQLTGELDIDTI